MGRSRVNEATKVFPATNESQAPISLWALVVVCLGGTASFVWFLTIGWFVVQLALNVSGWVWG
jgi:hypothetical protein